MNTDRLDLLLDAYFDEALTEKDRAELEYLLLSSPQAREHFWKCARFHAVLRRFGTENWGRWLAQNSALNDGKNSVAPALATAAAKKYFSWNWPTWMQPGLRWAMTAAVLMLLSAIIFWPTQKKNADKTRTATIDQSRGVAELVHAVDVEWAAPSNRLGAGSVLSPGWLKFKRGLVELQFYRGARVVLEGPAEFQVVSDMEAVCGLGKLRVDVPPSAHGFKVLAPNAQVVDLGTAFGMQVRADGQSDMQVLEGQVKMADKASPLRNFNQGQAVHVDGSGQMNEVAPDGKTYLSPAEVERRVNDESRRQFQGWREFSQIIAQDPSLLLYYDFENSADTDHLLANRAKASVPDSAGTIVGCQWTEGRWPTKRALDFKQFGDRVRFSLSSKPDSLTCMAWVRVDGLSHAYSALLMSGDGTVGETQWQLKTTGEIVFGKRMIPGWGQGHVDTCVSPSLINPEQMGLWMHLAFVYDAKTRTVTHFLNGQAVSTKMLSSEQTIGIGTMEIGNWTPREGEPMEPVRNFNGRMDEFAVFGRALSAEEIAHAFEVGRPN